MESLPGKDVNWTADINVELPINYFDGGPGGLGKSVKAQTTIDFFTKIVKQRGDNEALHFEVNEVWQSLTWNQYYSLVMQFAKACEAFGITQRKAVNIFSCNSWQWVVSYLGAVFHNNIATGVYATTNAEGCIYQANHSEAEVIIVDTVEKLRLIVSILHKCPQVKVVAAWGLEDN